MCLLQIFRENIVGPNRSLIALAKISSRILNSSGETGYLYLVSDLREKATSFAPLGKY